MMSTRLTAILTAAALGTSLAGCSTDEKPEADNPPAATESTSETETPQDSASPSAAPSEPAETTEEPTTAAPEGDLPTDVEDYAQEFVTAAKEDNSELFDKLGTDEAVASIPEWRDLDLGATEVSEGIDVGTAFVTFFSDDGVRLGVVVDIELAEAGSEDAVLSAEVIVDDDEPVDALPTDVEEYAQEFVTAAQEDNSELFDKLGTDEAVASIPEWRDLDLGATEVSEGPEEGTALVQFFSDGGVSLGVVVDVELAEAGSEGAVLSAEVIEDGDWSDS